MGVQKTLTSIANYITESTFYGQVKRLQLSSIALLLITDHNVTPISVEPFKMAPTDQIQSIFFQK